MKLRILSLCLLLGVALIATLPAFANHQWTMDVTSVVCDAATNTVTFEAYHSGGVEPLYGALYTANGMLVDFVGFYTDDPPYPPAGTYEFSYTNPAFTEGVEVTVFDYSLAGTAVCENAAASAYCPNPTPADFVVRSIPAGALAFFEPSEGAYAGFNLPPGTWYAGAAENGFVEVWIACQGSNIFVPAANVVG